MGAGAIGGFLAAALAMARIPVAIVARGEHAAAIRRDGLTVESDLGTFSVPVTVSDEDGKEVARAVVSFAVAARND